MGSTELPPVVCFAGDDFWHSNPHSRYHFMQAAHRRGHHVLWVNSIGMNMPKVGRRGFGKRVLLRLRSWSRWLKPARERFHVLAPIALPLFGNRLLERMNDHWLRMQIALAYRLTGIRHPLVFASIPVYAEAIARLPRRGLIYYYSDRYDAYRDITARDAIARRDRQLFAAADAVFCASAKIHARLRDQRPAVHYLPHAVDFEHFHRAVVTPPPAPADLAGIPRPRLGYFGSLTDSNDQELIRHAARREPDWHFVLIGRVLGDFRSLAELPNVHFLGYKAYGELPAYGAHFDAAFMNWKVTDWIRHSNPLKAKEYLSLGLPVVSVPIEEIERKFADLVWIADTPERFHDALAEALRTDGPELRRRRIDRVAGESWDARWREMIALYEETRHAG